MGQVCRWVCAFALALSLESCATSSKGASGLASIFNRPSVADIHTAVENYCTTLYSDPRLDPIRGKIVLWKEEATISMMANDQKANSEEQAAILAYADQRQRCLEYEAQQFGAIPASVDAYRRANSQVLADLYSGQITFGQCVRSISQNGGTLRLQLEQSAQVAAQQQAANAQAAQQLFLQQQQVNLQQQAVRNAQMRALIPQPPVNVNCTTQYIGNQAYTNCH